MKPTFEVYAMGLVTASVCTSRPVQDATKTLNRKFPTGISSPWVQADDPEFADGTPHPQPCQKRPETHTHYLFIC